MNYFELYPGDYLRDTTRLSLVEHGAYLRLLMTYYAEEQPLPGDLGELYVIVSAVSAADKAAVKKVAERYFPVGEDGLRRNARADDEIAKALKRIATSRENGGKGGRPKKPDKNPAGNPAGIPAGNPVGFENPAFEKPSGNPAETHSGEALHTPDPMHKNHGISESAQGKPPARSPAADHAIALNRLGVRITAHDPRLLEAVAENVTVQQLIDLAQANPGKNAAYLIATARGQLRDAATIPAGIPHAPDQPRESLADRNARIAAEILARTGTPSS